MHSRTHTVNNELLALMGKHTKQSYTQQHPYNLSVWEKQREREGEREHLQRERENISVWNYRFASTCVQIHRGDCLLLKCHEASHIQQHSGALSFFSSTGWKQQGCRNQLLSIKSLRQCALGPLKVLLPLPPSPPFLRCRATRRRRLPLKATSAYMSATWFPAV